MVNDESKLQVDKKRDKQERKILDTQVGFTSNLKIIFFGAILSWNKLDQRSYFLGRFWVPKDWSNIILSWRTSFRNAHSGMSTALHRANWVQQNLTSRKCSSTPLYLLMHHWLSFSRSCVMMKMTPGIDWTMSLACARIPPRCQEKRSLLAGILLVWYCYCPLGLESVSPTNSWRLGNLGYCPCSSYCPCPSTSIVKLIQRSEL